MLRRRFRPSPMIMAVAVAAVVAGLGVGLSMVPDRGVTISEAAPPPAPVGAPVITPQWETFPDLFKAGLDNLRAGRPVAAERSLAAAVALAPRVPEAHVNLGFARLDLGRWQAAEKAFRTAIDLRPNQANAYYGLAISLEQQKDIASARGAMRTYLHLTPEDDPYRRKAMAALWEWEAAPQAAAATAAGAPAGAAAALDAAAKAFSDLVLPRVGGGREPLGAFRGRVVIVNFWATWCPPCRAELPSLQKLSETLGARRYAVIGISVDTDSDFVGEFLREAGVRYPNYFDAGGNTTRFLRTAGALPLTLLLDAQGRIRDQVVGMRNWTAPEMIARIRRLDSGEPDDSTRSAATGTAPGPGGGQ